MTNKNLKKLVAWKRQKDDQKFPSTRNEDLLARWNSTKGRVLPTVSPYKSADEDSNRNENMEAQESDKEGGKAAM